MLNSLGKLKDLYALKKQADAMKKQMEAINVVVDYRDYEICMRGDQTISYVKEKGVEKKDLVELFNKAVKESQKKVAQKMKGQFSDMGFPGI